MIAKIKEEVIEIYKKIQDDGFDVYLVGGCVRNILMDKSVTDWDLTTNATPDQIQKLFPDSFYDNAFGTVGIPYEKESIDEDSSEGKVCEVTTFRTEHGYSDRRRPDKVEWGKTIEEDLSRRDFTVNAIALKLSILNSLPAGRQGQFSTNIVDPYNGQDDIRRKIIRAVGKADERFKEDALRLLRAVRFATQLEFTIEENTWNAVVEDAELLSHVSAERIRDELLKILESNHPYEGVMLLHNAKLLEIIIPEFLKGKDISMVRPGRHHTTDVFTHNLLSLKHCTSKDAIVRLATLLHDVGKPEVVAHDENNLVTFYNHEVAGARIAKDIAKRLRLTKKQVDKIFTLVRWHMFTVDEKITDSAVRRFIRRVGVDNVKDMIDLRIGDRLGGGTQVAESWRLKRFKERIEQQLNPPFSINDMAVDGNDVMKELNIKPGPKVGEILQKLFEEVDEDLSKNNREYLIQRIHEVYNKE